MLEQVVFTIAAFILFIYVLLFKLVKKNDTTYLTILALQATGILLNLIRVNFNILNSVSWKIVLYIFCVIIPIAISILEFKNINISETIRIIKAQIYLWLDKPKKAKAILVDLVKKYEESYIGHKMLAHMYEQEGGMRKAIDEYVQVLEIKKNDYNSYYRISELLNELGRNEEASQMLRTLLKNKPQMYQASKLLGRIYLEQKEYKKAIEIYTNALKHSPENYEIYYNLGVCYAMINDFEISRKCFQKTVEINEDIYLAYYRLGQIALLYRDFDVAEENFTKSLYNEKEAKAYFELAKIHVMKNQKSKAILDVKNCIKVDSSYYSKIQKEPTLFPIKQSIEKPQNETKNEYEETAEEKIIDEYLNNTYNLTKILNKKRDIEKKKNT